MNQKKIILGAFWIEGYDKPFFGLRDAKNHQLLKGGNILNPYKKLIYPDPFPDALACTKCENRIIPKPIVEGEKKENEETKTPQTVCDDCGGRVVSESIKEVKKEESKGFFGFFK